VIAIHDTPAPAAQADADEEFRRRRKTAARSLRRTYFLLSSCTVPLNGRIKNSSNAASLLLLDTQIVRGPAFLASWNGKRRHGDYCEAGVPRFTQTPI
jgi:hypothetical protein